MTRWEYCDVIWQPGQVVITFCKTKEAPLVKTYGPELWPQLLARLGSEGWEMSGAISSPTGVQEYFFYFKRPLAAE
jgi:hypothetical protein